MLFGERGLASFVLDAGLCGAGEDLGGSLEVLVVDWDSKSLVEARGWSGRPAEFEPPARRGFKQTVRQKFSRLISLG